MDVQTAAEDRDSDGTSTSTFTFGVGGISIKYDERQLAFYSYDSHMKVDSIHFQVGKSDPVSTSVSVGNGASTIDALSSSVTGSATPIFTIGGDCECVEKGNAMNWSDMDMKSVADFHKQYESDAVYKFINSELQADEGDMIVDLEDELNWSDKRYLIDRCLYFLSIHLLHKGMKLEIVGLPLRQGFTLARRPRALRYFTSKLWFLLDVLPYVNSMKGSVTMEDIACNVARQAEQVFQNSNIHNIPRIIITDQQQVKPDFDSRLIYCDIGHYRPFTAPAVLSSMMKLRSTIGINKLVISFFSSTPSGGGVALMRHALIRYLTFLGIDARWYVLQASPNVAIITKYKFHNVLQGISRDASIHLQDTDKALYEKWGQMNAETYFSQPFQDSNLIVIDDPQPLCLVPYIRKINPQCKLAFRSHIQLNTELIETEGTEANHVWKYLMQYIQHTDYFISHPIDTFIPYKMLSSQLCNSIYKFPATTDCFDGLNKPLASGVMKHYQRMFNRIALAATGRVADFQCRRYITQVARFDPSKGIPSVLASYGKLRKRYEKDDKQAAVASEEKDVAEQKVSEIGTSHINNDIPQLILCGHGSIDDPQGSEIFEQTRQLVQSKYAEYAEDIIFARVPACDQLLNCIMRGATIALQLSIAEGFEVKVTEAIMKGVPIIAYNTGGIPLQIQHNVNGFLVDVMDEDRVAELMYQLLNDQPLYQRVSKAARDTDVRQYLTPANAERWCNLLCLSHQHQVDHE